MGLELTTPKSSVICSSDWANRHPSFFLIETFVLLTEPLAASLLPLSWLSCRLADCLLLPFFWRFLHISLILYLQWFSVGFIVPHSGHMAMSGDTFDCCDCGRRCRPAPRRHKLGTLQTSYNAQDSPHDKELNVTTAKVERLCSVLCLLL